MGLGRNARGWRRAGGVGFAVLMLLAAASCGKAPPHGLTDTSETFAPRGVPWNGVRVYLSAPRHTNSGSRGECGWEENANGRIFALYAADLNTLPGETTLTERGYEVRVSANSQLDQGFIANRDESNNWGANVHIPIHSNAVTGGCPNDAQYVLAMFNTTNPNSSGLATQLVQQLDPHVPGHQNSWNCDTLAECSAAAPHVAYLELFFHTSQAAVDWFQGGAGDPHATGGWNASPYLGAAVDAHLGNPRATETASALDRYPGFGRTPETMLRDETIAYWEAFRRQELVAECMSDAGFSYSPAVAFPAQDAADIAESLGIDSSSAASSSPHARNQQYEAGLSAAERDRYNQTLVGESAADIASTNETGIVPAGRSAADFATGGCVGAAATAIPSIWDAPRSLDADLASLSRSSDAAGQSPVLEAQAARYADAMSTITADDALADYLAATT